MACHRFDRSRVKRHRSYTIEEAATTIGASRGTIRRWIDSGALPAITDRRPFLILGSDLADFLAERARPKRPCPPGTCYCVKCREVREPAGGMAEYRAINATSGNLRAICPVCDCFMHRRTSLAQLRAIGDRIDVSIREAPTHLMDCERPSLNEHIR